MSATEPKDVKGHYILLVERTYKKLLNPVLALAFLGGTYLVISRSLKRGTFTEDTKAATLFLLALAIFVFLGRIFQQELQKWQRKSYFHRFILEFVLLLLSLTAYHFWQLSRRGTDSSWKNLKVIEDVVVAALTALVTSFFESAHGQEHPAQRQEGQLPERDDPIA